ncbi:leucine-zipper-like transcriptional regulator 1 [Anaeramoeba ignava]|uniref:Leucine-zipper-like transcriptional regulator 1 n=1 Tax=Anaeramoeba ignava TaxID=1746090 RepID=A0A9Q0RBM6_ANAIG|nr:leucine-zipper-like transcriptional regulator 1 [Anaeramoeba ignava]
MRIGKENVSKIIELLKTRSQELIRAFLMFIYSERMSEEYEKQIGEILEETKISTKEKQMSSLREDLRKYYNDKESTDFTIISEGNRIKVHKSILMARSKLYYGMFVSVNDSSGQVNDYSGKSFKTIESLVKFLYFDDFDSDLPNSVLNELIDCVDYFQLNKYSIYALKLEEFRNKNSNNKCIFF